MAKKSIIISFLCIVLVLFCLINITKAEDEDLSDFSIDEVIAEVDKSLSDIALKINAEIERYKRKIEEEPDNAYNYYNLGLLYFLNGENEESFRLAEKNWEKAISLDPKLEDGILSIKEAGKRESIEEVKMEMKKRGKVIRLLKSGKRNLEEGRKLNDEEMVKDAVSDLNQAIEADNTIALFYKLLGDAYYWLYEKNKIDEYLEKAEEAWEEAVKRDPSFELFTGPGSSSVNRGSETPTPTYEVGVGVGSRVD